MNPTKKASTMSTRYDELAPTDLEAQVYEDLAAALQKRGADVQHDGRPGRPDIVIEAEAFCIVVEVAARSGADAASEFLAILDHQNIIERELSKPTHLLFCCQATPPRIIRAMREQNARAREQLPRGTALFLSLPYLERVLAILAKSAADLYPLVRWEAWFHRWEGIGDDLVALEKFQQSVLREDHDFRDTVRDLSERRAVQAQESLRKGITKLEDNLRHRNVTRTDAMRVLVYLMFVKLYEEKREASGLNNRFTEQGFAEYRLTLSARDKNRYHDRTLQHLIDNELLEDSDIASANILVDATLPRQVTDNFIGDIALPFLDHYRFRGTHLDALGAVFEAVARRAEKDTRIGQFFTPEPIVRFAVEVCQPGPTELVCDPACGTARFLVYSMERMISEASEVKDVSEHETREAIYEKRLLGTDADRWIVTIAKMNMYIHGDGKTNIVCENGLFLSDLAVFKPAHETLLGQVDLVLTNPPLGEMSHQAYAQDLVNRKESPYNQEEDWLRDRLPLLPGEWVEEKRIRAADEKIAQWRTRHRQAIEEGDSKDIEKAERWLDYHKDRKANAKARLGRNEGTYEVSGSTAKGGALFIAAIKDYLNPISRPSDSEEWRGGRVGIIVDEAILNTPEYGATRRFIRENFFIKAIFSFSRDAFWYQARTTAKTSLLYLHRKPDASVEQREPIFFAHIEHTGFGRTGKPESNDIPDILRFYRRFREDVRSSYSGFYFVEKTARSRINQWIDEAKEVRVKWATSVPESTDTRLDYAFEAARQIRLTLPQDHPTLGKFVEPAVRHPPEDPLGIYSFGTVERSSGEVRHREDTDTSYRTQDLLVIRTGDIVVSGIDLVNGSVGFAGRNVDGLVVSKEFYTLRLLPSAKDEVDPQYLALLLRTEHSRRLVAGLVTGTSNRTRVEDVDSLLSLPLPELPDLETQRALAERVRGALKLRQDAQASLSASLQEADLIWKDVTSRSFDRGNAVESWDAVAEPESDPDEAPWTTD